MMDPISRRLFLQRIAGLSALGTVSACGKTPSKKESGGAPLSLQAPWVNDAEFIGYYVAMSNNLYDSEGISLEYKSGGPEKIAAEVLAAGACDIALSNIDGIANAIVNEGAPFKIVGAQYQKSPLGIVSLIEAGIHKPVDLSGKKVAAPPANKSTTEAFLRLNGVDPASIRFVDYQYDPTILIDGIVDATVDFVTNIPYTIRLQGKTPSYFLFADFGFNQYMDVIVVTDTTLNNKRELIKKFMIASRKGWEENFKDTSAYPKLFMETYYKDTGRNVDNEEFFNLQQKPLIETTRGIFHLDQSDIENNIRSLASVGLSLNPGVFVTDLA